MNRRNEMATRKKKREERRRAGSKRRDAQHRTGGDWTTMNIPEGVDIFTPKEKSFRLDIVPFKVGQGNPYAESGEWYYERTFFVHRGIGPEGNSYVCPAKTSGGKCPICEERAQLARDPDGDENLIKDLRPKERQIFLFLDRDEEEKGVQIFEFSNWNFGRLLDERRQEGDEDGDEYVAEFDDPGGGAVLRVKFKEESGGGYKYMVARSIDFKPRPNGLDEKYLEHGICPDDLLKILDYDELKKVFLQIEDDDDDDDDESEEKPKRRAKAKAKAKPKAKAKLKDDDEDGDDWDDDDDEPAEKPKPRKKKPAERTADDAGLEEGMTVDHDDHGKCEITRISKDGTSLILEDEDGEEHRAVGVDDVTVPKNRKAKAKPKPADDDDDDDDEPAEKPKRKPKAKAKSKPKEDDDDDDGGDDNWDDDDDDWDD